jgi:hypothetical protein
MSPLGSLDELAPPKKKGRAWGLSDDAGPEGAASEENAKTEGVTQRGWKGNVSPPSVVVVEVAVGGSCSPSHSSSVPP